jgi:hypothetical protein
VRSGKLRSFGGLTKLAQARVMRNTAVRNENRQAKMSHAVRARTMEMQEAAALCCGKLDTDIQLRSRLGVRLDLVHHSYP